MKTRYRVHDPARMDDPATQRAVRARLAHDFPGITLEGAEADPALMDASLEAILDELVLIGVAVRVPESVDA